MRKAGAFGGIALVVCIAAMILFFVTGTRQCGNVYRAEPDKAGAIERGDTVPASLANGDTSVYRFECVGGGRNPAWLILAGLAGVAALILMRKRDTATTASTRPTPAPGPSAPHIEARWSCAHCHTMNDGLADRCGRCGRDRFGGNAV